MSRIRQQTRKLLFISSFVLFLSFANVSSIKLTPSGGYSVVLAISEDYPAPSEEAVEGYIRNIRGVFHQLSIRLWTASRGTFFIQDVSVKIPTSWKRHTALESQVGVAATEYFNTADVRISPDFSKPHVENPNACGISGQFIELPLSFSVTGPYGPPAAALLNQWARFRYGVWEEHGYPSEEEFPYFYKKPNASSWQMNGCSDYPISGKYVDSSNDLCDNGDLDVPLRKDCRFVPDALNTAQSSYMTFHWLNSIQEFCDEDTHNSEAPNRQNYLCGHRSVWEVLRQTSDFQAVTNPLGDTSVPALKLSVVRTSPNPRFYVLVDQGRTTVAPYVLNDLLANVTSFFTGSLDSTSTVAAIGTFPADCDRSGSNYVTEKVGWTSIVENRDLFVQALNDMRIPATNRPLIRDFGRAILEVVQNINSFQHEAGSVLLVVKTGVAENTFEQMTYEEDVIAEVKKFGNVKIYAAELVTIDSSSSSPVNLKTLAEETGGKHVAIAKSYDTRTKFIPVAEEIVGVLSSPMLRIDDNDFVIIQREYVLPDTHIKIPILVDDLTSLEFHLTTGRAVRTGEIVLTPDSAYARNSLSVKYEWDEQSDRKKRSIHSFKATDNISKNTTWTLYYPCVGEVADCRAHLLVHGRKLRPSVNADSERVDIIVSTSAENNIVDMSHFNDHEGVQSPFSIFAKITQNRHPVRNLIVTAHIELIDGSENWTAEMIDDGQLRPDISKHDGIYSTIFIPPKDALYKISVSVRTSLPGNDDQVLELISKSILMPKDQRDMECTSTVNECTSTTLTSQGFQQVIEFPGQITVINAVTFMPGRPFRISDFQVITASNYVVYFVFTSPTLLGLNGIAQPDQYNFYYSPRLKTLIGTVDGNAVMGAMIGSPSGDTVIFQYATMEEVTVYYAVEAVYGSLRSGPSNIIGVKTVKVGNDSAIPTTSHVPSTTTGFTSTIKSTPVSPIPTSKIPYTEKSDGGTSTTVIVMSVLALTVLVIGASGILCYRPNIFRNAKSSSSDFNSTSSLNSSSLDRSTGPRCTSISTIESV